MFLILLWAYTLNIDIVSSDFPHKLSLKSGGGGGGGGWTVQRGC